MPETPYITGPFLQDEMLFIPAWVEVERSGEAAGADPLVVTVTAPGGCTAGDPVTLSVSISGGVPHYVDEAMLDALGLVPYTIGWTLGDGNYSSVVPELEHTYAADGTYTVTVNVRDAAGQTEEIAADVEVVEAGDLWVDFTGTPTTLAAGNEVTFSWRVGTGNPNYAVNWNLGDGGSTTYSSTPASGTYGYTYLTPGTYTVTLSVTDGISRPGIKVRTGYVTVT